MRTNTWRITGYRGSSDYDGPADNNTDFELIMDRRFTQRDVEEIMFNYWRPVYRVVAIKAELVNDA